MTGSKSNTSRVLDVVVFGPTGLALTLLEEFPKLVEKGRHRIEGQVHTARLVGQFAVQEGRRRIDKKVSSRRHSTPRSPAPSAGRSSASRVPAGDTDKGRVPRREGAFPLDSTGERAVGSNAGAADGTTPSHTLGASENGSAASTDALAIPGYDSLSASQVVQRLAGLSLAELEEVRSHELSHRQRRTILNRLDQLTAEAGLGDL